MQDTKTVSVSTTALPTTDICANKLKSFGYTPARVGADGDTYLIYALLETPSKGNVIVGAGTTPYSNLSSASTNAVVAL